MKTINEQTLVDSVIEILDTQRRGDCLDHYEELWEELNREMEPDDDDTKRELIERVSGDLDNLNLPVLILSRLNRDLENPCCGPVCPECDREMLKRLPKGETKCINCRNEEKIKTLEEKIKNLETEKQKDNK